MPDVLEPADLLVSEAQLVPLGEALSLPPDRLLGVTAAARTALEGLGVTSIFDLAMSRVFNGALQVVDAALNPANAMNRFGRPMSDLLQQGIAGTVPIADLRNQPLDVLADIDDPAAVTSALGVVTVRDLAVYPPFRAAREILNRAFFPEQLAEFDPERPPDLVPKSGEFPTERVQYTTLILDSVVRPDNAPPLIDLASGQFQPIDAAAVADPAFGFSTISLGMLLTLNQSWFMQGVTLGHLLHSMALAAGESTRIAVVDWSRKVSAGQTEVLGETEDLSQDTSRNRSISEVTQAVANEAQSGFSHSESKSTTKQGGGSFGLAVPSIGLGIGGSASAGKTTTSADSYSTSAGHREIGASMLQNATDRTHQHAHSARTRRASVVREVSQTEHESVSTRVVTNYNHMHALTVQYYEVVQIYRTETSVAKCDRVVFVPFKLLDFSNADLLRRFRGALIDAALTPQIQDALVNFDTLELVPERRAPFTRLGGPLAEVLANARIVARPTALARIRDGEPGESPTDPPIDPDPPPRPPRPPRPPLGGSDVADALWDTAASRLSVFFGRPAVRRNSESLFLPSDVQVHEGAVQSTVRTIKLVFVLRDGTRIVDLTQSIPLVDVAHISFAGSDPLADVAATGVLAMSRNGVVFPLELPTVTVPRGASETKVLEVRAAGADVNVVQHLADNRLHYSQAVFRALDAAMIAGLLAPFSIRINGTDFPLVQVAEPVPLRIVGNALAFKINTDPVNDAEWREFMANRGIRIGQAKVDIVPLSSGGIFAEAVLGRSNSAEKLDISRFFNWQDSPIPIQPSDIAAIQTGTRATQENLTPGQFSAPLVSITPPASLPDPTGLAGTLAAIQNGNLFRDMSGLAETIKLAGETGKLSGAGAASAATQATEAMKAAVDLAKAKLGKPLGDKTPTEQGAVINKEEELKKKQAAAGGAATGGAASSSGASGGPSGGAGSAGASGGSGGGASSGTGGGAATRAPTTTGNAALDRIIGNDDALRTFIGMSADSPEPTPSVTAEGVPLQELDSAGIATLWVKATPASEQDLPTRADLDEIIAKDLYKVDSANLESLLTGGHRVPGGGFDNLLRRLSLAPAGSVRTLNIAVHCTSTLRLDYFVDWTYTRGTDSIEHDVQQAGNSSPLFSPDMAALMQLLASPEVTVGGIVVKLSDVRKAFAVDGEVHIFNMSNPLSEDFVQVISNVFQVRTSAFVRRSVRVRATVVGEIEDGDVTLSKKIDIGFPGDPPGPAVDFFAQLLTLDRARTGLYTAFPRRP